MPSGKGRSEKLADTASAPSSSAKRSLVIGRRANRLRRLGAVLVQGLLLVVTSASLFTVLFIFYFIARDAWPFFRDQGIVEFFTSTEWYPSGDPPAFGALAILVGSGLVTFGAVLVAVPLGVSAAVCLSDVLPFSVRQLVKPIIEMLAAIPSVAYGFFALVVFAPLLQEKGGALLAVAACIVGAPVAVIAVVVVIDLATSRLTGRSRKSARLGLGGVLGS